MNELWRTPGDELVRDKERACEETLLSHALGEIRVVDNIRSAIQGVWCPGLVGIHTWTNQRRARSFGRYWRLCRTFLFLSGETFAETSRFQLV